jgi:hypothetical protein
MAPNFAVSGGCASGTSLLCKEWDVEQEHIGRLMLERDRGVNPFTEVDVPLVEWLVPGSTMSNAFNSLFVTVRLPECMRMVNTKAHKAHAAWKDVEVRFKFLVYSQGRLA